MISAVLDCMIYLQAANNRTGASGACLTLAEDGHIQIFLSPVMLAEVTDVLSRPAIRATFPKLTDALVQTFVVDVHAVTQSVEEPPAEFAFPHDPKDEPYLNLAIQRQPSFLVTWDKDMLPLMDDDEFKKQFPTLTILKPPAFLAIVRAAITKDLGSA